MRRARMLASIVAVHLLVLAVPCRVTAAPQSYRFEPPAPEYVGSDCRFAPPRLAFDLVLDAEATAETVGLSSDGEPLRVKPVGGGRFEVTRLGDGKPGLLLIADRPPRLEGEYALRGLNCTARVPGSGGAAREDSPAYSPHALVEASAAAARLLDAAEAQRKGDYRSASETAQRAATASAGSVGADHPLTLRAAFAQASAMSNAGQPGPAVNLAMQTWKTQETVLGPMHPDTRSTRAGIAWQLFLAGRTADAITFAEETLAVLDRELGRSDRTYVRLYGQLGTLFAANGEAQKARGTLEEALVLQKAAGSDRLEGITTRNSLAITFMNLGLPRERLEVLKAAANEANEVLGADHPLALGVRVNLADALLADGQHAAALQMAEETRAGLAKRLGPGHPNVALVDKLLGQIYKALGRFEVALAAVDSAIDIYTKSLGPEHPRTIFCINDRAGLFGELGRHAEAAAEQRRAYELSERALGANNLETLKYLSNLGWTALVAGDSRGAFDAATAADERLAALGPSGETLRTRNRRILARATAALGQVSAARRRMEEAASHLERVHGPHHTDTIVARAELGDLQLRDGDKAAAKASFRAVVDRMEAVRADVGLTPDQRAAFSQLAFDAYTSLATLLMEEGKLREGFDVVERSKARRLLDELTERIADVRSGLEPADRQLIADERRRIAWLDESIASTTEPAARLQLETERNERYRALAERRRLLKSKYPTYQRLSEVRLVEAQKLAKLLPPSAVFVSYFSSGDRLHAVTVESGGVLRWHALGSVTAIARKVHVLRAASSNLQPDENLLAALTSELSRELIDALRIGSRARTWIVAPDGDLALLPFELLSWRGAALAATVNLQYVQSASVFALLAERRDQYRAAPRRPSVFAVGGALYSGGPAAQRGLSLRGVVGSGMEIEATRGKRERLALAWPELPHSELEARSVAQLFPGSKLLVGSQASEAELLRTEREGELANYRYLLFATHGYLDLESPQLSAVVLSQVGTEGEDGYVTAAEWLGYRLRSDLTVLSACETGVGRQVRGEGVWGLPYALFVAGNTNTLVTLWPVADQSTALFVQRFFARLRKGHGHAVALAETKREFLRDRRLRAPIHWAGFVLYGV